MRAIVNLSTSKYFVGQSRLIKSISDAQNEQIRLLFCKSSQDYSGDNMYTFKPKSIQEAFDHGSTSVLWLDASMLVIKDLSPIFDHIEKHGYFFQYSGWMNNRWTNQRAKDYFGTNEGSMLSSGVIGLDFRNPLAIQFFEQWKQSANDGIFNGSHEDHRHDQTCASIIAHKLGMSLTPNNTYWNYGKEPMHDKILILADGIS